MTDKYANLTQLAGPNNTKTPEPLLYEVSSWQIFYRNFLAGFSRSIGSVIIWVIFLLVSLGIFTHKIWPSVKPMYEDYQKALNLLDDLDTTQSDPVIEIQPLPDSLNQHPPSTSNLPDLNLLLADPDFQALIQKYQNSPSASQ